MGYFDALTRSVDDSYFKMDESGRILFMPYGTNQRAYLIPDEVTRLRIRRGMIWVGRLWGAFMITAAYLFLAMIGLLWLGRWMFVPFGLVLLGGLVHVLIVSRLVRGLAVTSEKHSCREFFPKQDPAKPPMPWFDWALLGLGVSLACVSVIRALHASELKELLAGSFGVVFFLFMIGYAIFSLRVTARPARNNSA